MNAIFNADLVFAGAKDAERLLDPFQQKHTCDCERLPAAAPAVHHLVTRRGVQLQQRPWNLKVDLHRSSSGQRL